MQSGAGCAFSCMSKKSHPSFRQHFCYCLRWAVLPKMSKESCGQSALFIGNGDDDAAVLVVGGYGGNWNEAALLTNRPHQRGGEQGSGGGGGAWRWQQLSPMREGR